jgi:hypothetical protein
MVVSIESGLMGPIKKQKQNTKAFISVTQLYRHKQKLIAGDDKLGWLHG